MKNNPVLLSLVLWMLGGLSLFPESNAQAPSLYLGVDARSWCTVKLGIEYPIQDEKAKLHFDASVPVLQWGSGSGFDSFQLRFGVVGIVKPVSDMPVCLVYEGLLSSTVQSQVLGSFAGFGTVVSLKPLGTFGGFSIGPVFTWNKVWLTRLSLSQEVKNAFDDSSPSFKPAHGWYAWGASEILLGLGASLSFDKKRDNRIFLELGPRFTWKSLAGLTEGFPLGEWPFWLEFGWKKSF